MLKLSFMLKIISQNTGFITQPSLLIEWSVQFQVCGISLSKSVVEIIFHVFDMNDDGNLSSEELVRVLQKRERDIAQPMESGIMGFFSCCCNHSNYGSISGLLSWLFRWCTDFDFCTMMLLITRGMRSSCKTEACTMTGDLPFKN